MITNDFSMKILWKCICQHIWSNNWNRMGILWDAVALRLNKMQKLSGAIDMWTAPSGHRTARAKKDGTRAATKRQLLGLMIEVWFQASLSLKRNKQGDVSWIMVICFVTGHLPRLHQLYSVVMTLHHDSRHASQAFVAPQWSWELGTWICIKWGIAQSGKEAISNIYIYIHNYNIYIYIIIVIIIIILIIKKDQG